MHIIKRSFITIKHDYLKITFSKKCVRIQTQLKTQCTKIAYFKTASNDTHLIFTFKIMNGRSLLSFAWNTEISRLDYHSTTYCPK